VTLQELMMLEDELADRGSECPFAPDQPSCPTDEEWLAEYSSFCHERLKKLTATDWALVMTSPELELLQGYANEYARG